MARFWSDSFDMDLLKLWPDLPESIGEEMANVRLYTHGSTSHGRLNHPAVWNGHGDHMVAFFGFSASSIGKPDFMVTADAVVECTWLEALRDCWAHHYAIILGGRRVWMSQWRPFEQLMYDLRGWSRLDEWARDQLRGQVLGSIAIATRQLREMCESVTPTTAPARTSGRVTERNTHVQHTLVVPD